MEVMIPVDVTGPTVWDGGEDQAARVAASEDGRHR